MEQQAYISFGSKGIEGHLPIALFDELGWQESITETGAMS